jgi:hypothetical protein
MKPVRQHRSSYGSARSQCGDEHARLTKECSYKFGQRPIQVNPSPLNEHPEFPSNDWREEQLAATRSVVNYS